MLADLEILMIAAAILVIAGVIREAHGRMNAHGLLKLAWRWHTGQPWHGKPLTDAGWLRPATDKRAATVTGHAARFHYLPRWKRTVRRTGRSVAAAVLAVLWYTHPAEGLAAASLTAALLAGYASWRSWRRWESRAHRRTWLEPLHLVAAPMVGIPVAAPAGSWLEVEPDRSRAAAALPPGYNPDAKERDRLALTFAAKLGIEAPEVRWQLAGPAPRLELTASQPPPAKVVLGSVREALEAARPDELVWGLGKKGVVVKTSLSGDSPHVGLSMGSGAGKSVTARTLLAQQLNRGAIGLVLDIKMISHHWAEGLPNVAIARRPHEIHAALLWLGREVERRNEVALAGADMDGNVHAVVGPRIIVICEELNAAVSRLRAYWRQEKDTGDPVRSPALEALDATSFMGRQVRVNLVYIGQRLSVRASGGDGDARENIGVIAFSRYSASNWKMLAGEHPMPPKSLAPGRLQVVSDKVQETQGILMTAREARELAVSGTVSPLPAGMPGARVTGPRTDLTPASGQPFVIAPEAAPVTAGPALVTLSEAVREGIVSRSLPALRIARFRGQLPEPAGLRGTAQEFDPVALAEWDRAAR
jgi:hypothetical protein